MLFAQRLAPGVLSYRSRVFIIDSCVRTHDNLGQNQLRARGASEWVVQGKGVGTAMGLGSGVASEMGFGGGAFGAAAAHDIGAARYNQKHGIDPTGNNRGNLGHNTVAAGMFGF